MRAATLFSGIGAPELACPHWSWLWHAEIEPFPAAVMAHHHPTSINLGDVLAGDFLERTQAHPVDVLVGGPPCQAFSVAGLRGGLADPRGNLTLRWVQIIHASRPAFALTENVPGWLNTKDNAFGCFLGALVGADDALAAPPGGGWPSAGMVAGPLQRACWRVLDAQYFGLAQRRQRVFVVSCPADGGDPSQVLFERQGVRGNTAQSEGAGQGIAGAIGARTCNSVGAQDAAAGHLIAFGGNNTSGPIDVATALNAHGGPNGRCDFESETFVAHSLRGEGFDASEDGTGRGTPIVPVAYRTSGNCGAWSTGDHVDTLSTGTDPSSHLIGLSCKDHGAGAGDLAPTLRSMGHTSSHANGGGQVAVAFAQNQLGELRTGTVCNTLNTNSNATGRNTAMAQQGMSVRRLTPTECERLQGFPEVSISATLVICNNSTGLQKKRALVAPQSRRSPPSASNAGEGKSDARARHVEQSSLQSRQALDEPVVLHVRIDLERSGLEIRNAGKLIYAASNADALSRSPLPMPPGDFVHLVARTLTTLDRTIRHGEAASLQPTLSSTILPNGKNVVEMCGQEIDELVNDAAKFTTAVNNCMKSITSEAGRNSPTFAQTLATSFCCVTAAISSFIPVEILSASSYALKVEAIGGYTLIPGYDSNRTGKWGGNRGVTDGPRYRALGNSMAVPCVRWILSRIEAQTQANAPPDYLRATRQ